MFQYLDIPEMQDKIKNLEQPPKTELSSGEAILLKARLEKLNLLPVERPRVVCMELRRLTLDIMLQYFLPDFLTAPQMNCPGWIEKLVNKMETPEAFSCSLEELAAFSGCTREHLCRSFPGSIWEFHRQHT